MSRTSLDNRMCASAAEPEQGLGGSGSEEQHSLGGRIDLPTRPFSSFAGQMLPDKNAAAAVGNGGEALCHLVTDERINGQQSEPGKMLAQRRPWSVYGTIFRKSEIGVRNAHLCGK